MIALMAFMSGCSTQSFFDPSELGLGGHSEHPIVVPILQNLDTGVEEPDEQYATATDPRPSDLVPSATDNVIGPNDLIQVSISDLVAQGAETVKVSRVTESGFVSLPMLGQVKATGMTEAQLEETISKAYSDRNLLRGAQVAVTTVEARNRAFSILGAVGGPGQYPILSSNFRLLDALVLARDVTSQTGIEYIYIIRQKSQDPKDAEGIEGGTMRTPATQPTPNMLAPQSAAPALTSPKFLQVAQPAEGRTVTVDGQPMQIEGGQMVPPAGEKGEAEHADATGQSAPEHEDMDDDDDDFAFADLKEPGDVRVIRVPMEPLKRGELRFNLIVRPLDMIIVPQPVVGEYYVGGHVQRTGVYSLSARDITLRAAIIAAGGLDQLAIPERTEIVRKVSRFQTVYSRVNLAKVFNGEEPDILLKKDDQIMVGTNALAPFLAAFRNGFRITYGFGFLYDKNYNEGNSLSF